MICGRCGGETHAIVCSFFNTDMICVACADAEKAHPRYAEAVEREVAACRRGDYNFAGIGLPADLRDGHAAA